MATSLTQGNSVPEHVPLVGAAAVRTVIIHPVEPDVEPVLPIHKVEVTTPANFFRDGANRQERYQKPSGKTFCDSYRQG